MHPLGETNTPERPEPTRFIDWTPAAEMPESDGVFVYPFNLAAVREAAAVLFHEVLRFPDFGGELILEDEFVNISATLQSQLLHVATELLTMNPVAITSAVTASGDGNFHLTVTQPSNGHFLITLEVPNTCSEFRVSGGYIQERCDGGDWNNVIAVADLKWGER